jgi:hypothetical protein
MNAQIKSIFNLIEIFRQTKKSSSESINAVSHCEQEQHHDFYCDAEKPFISF